MSERNWREFVRFHEGNARGFPAEHADMTRFFDFMQTTPEGRQIFAGIDRKLAEGQHYYVTFDNRGRTSAMGPALHVNMQDYRSMQIRDRDTRMMAPAGRENILIHELAHAGDPNMPFEKPGEVRRLFQGQRNPYTQPGPDGVPPNEAYATRVSAQFIEKYFPDRPVRAHYGDARETPQRDGQAVIDAAKVNPLIGNEALQRICHEEKRFMHGEVSARHEVECQNLPNTRPPAGQQR